MATTEKLDRGVSAGECKNGSTYFRVHYSADPGKDDRWAQSARQGGPVKEWLREMEMCEEIYSGEPVYADYQDSIHCPLDREPLEIGKGCHYIGGWDCGQTITPAFVLLQITRQPWQIQCVLEVVSPGAEPMESFAPRVQLALQRRLPAQWDEVEHWADTTVVQRNGANGETAQQAAKRFGLKLRPGSNEWVGRYGAVTWLLIDKIGLGGDQIIPRFVLDGLHCPVLREGFKGAYKFDQSAGGETVGPGRVLKEKPLKDSYSHVHDALQYAASRAKKLFHGGRFEVG